MAQGDQQQFCLRWNDFQTNMVSSFKHLRDEKSFTDVTLACDGQTCKAHKMVLSACSPYFKVNKPTIVIPAPDIRKPKTISGNLFSDIDILQ